MRSSAPHKTTDTLEIENVHFRIFLDIMAQTLILTFSKNFYYDHNKYMLSHKFSDKRFVEQLAFTA